MSWDTALGDTVQRVRREVERNAFRARNGLKYATGNEWAPVELTPSDVVWRQGKVHLRRYRRDTPARLGPPVLIWIGLVSRSWVFDLWKGNSFVQRLLDAGFDTYVLDWGEPDEEDAGNTLDTYVEGFIPRGIAAVLRTSGSSDVHVIGYCMGGCMSLMALANQPDLPVRNLITMAMPVDFRHMGPMFDGLRTGRVEIDSLIDHTGNVPASVVHSALKNRKPTADFVQYANLWQNLWNDDFVLGFQAMSR